jgi:spore maturation protein SpmB
MMKDLTGATLIKAKGILFLLLGLLSASLLFFGYPTPKTAVLLIIAIWSFCRFYYFAFYVIEHYVDPSYRFSGLLSFALYLIQKKGQTVTLTGNA